MAYLPIVPARAAVLLGGAAGTALRLAVVAGVGGWPWGTLVANLTGAAALGYLAGSVHRRPEPSPATAFLATGALGAYTTFSALAVEVLALLEGAPAAAAAYGIGALALGLVAAAAGLAAGGRRGRPSAVIP